MELCHTDYVTANVSKNVTKEEARDFPTLLAINAFRGYLDEYQKKRRPLKRKAAKAPKSKEHKKKPPKEVSHLGLLLSVVQVQG